MGNLPIEIELVTNATNCINYRSQNIKRFRETRAGSNFPKNLQAPGHHNSSRLEFSKKNLHSVIYETLGSHSHGFSIFFRKFEPARIFRKFLKLQVSKTRAGSNFPKKNQNYVIYEALGSHSYGFSIFFRKLEPARIFRKILKLQVSKTRAGSNFPKKT